MDADVVNGIWHKTKLLSAAGRTRRRLGNTSTCPQGAFRRLVRPTADDNFVICRNAHMDMCLCYQVDV